MKGFSLPLRIIVVAVLLLSFNSCMQYPEGPFFTLQTKDERLEGNWLIDKVIDANGNDVTSEYADQTLYVVAGRDSKSLSYFKSGSLYSFGTYAFADNSDDFIVIYTQYHGMDVSKEVLQIFFTVRKLTDTWFYYIDDNGIEFQWKKN
ncbi:MAG: hypothetical protein IPO83_11610 [Chitinophagaceae bacterium]|nr:hypothetical protein [Chitinophagaceae bacterium]